MVYMSSHEWEQFITCYGSIHAYFIIVAQWRHMATYGFMRRSNHYMNQCWLIIIWGQFYRKLFKISILDKCLKILNLKLLPYLAGGIQSRSDNQFVCTQFGHSPTWTYKISYERFVHTGTLNHKTRVCNMWFTNRVRLSWTQARCDCVMKRSVFFFKKHVLLVWSRFCISQYSVVYSIVLY